MENIQLLKLERATKGSIGWIAAVFLICLLTEGGGFAHGQSISEGEYSIKAAFLYNFAKFVEWPGTAFTDSSAPLVICVLGPDPFGNALDELEGKSAGKRAITIRRSRTIKEVGKCHILFVSKTLTGETDEIFPTVSRMAMLTISDMDRFAQRGGMIGLSTVANRIRFEINMKVAELAGLKLSSQLLKLATIVESTR